MWRANPNQTASVTPIVPSIRIMLVGFERNTLHAIHTFITNRKLFTLKA